MSGVTETVIERTAIAICYAGFVSDQGETPEEYWATISERGRAMYRREARHWVACWRGRDWFLVPAETTASMDLAAEDAHAGIRTVSGTKRVWSAMIKAAPHWIADAQAGASVDEESSALRKDEP